MSGGGVGGGGEGGGGVGGGSVGGGGEGGGSVGGGDGGVGGEGGGGVGGGSVGGGGAGGSGGRGGDGGGEGTAGGKAGGGLSHFLRGVVAPANMKTRPLPRQQSTERVTFIWLVSRKPKETDMSRTGPSASTSLGSDGLSLLLPALVEQKCGTSLPSGRSIKLPTCVTSKLFVAGSSICMHSRPLLELSTASKSK
jgi:hypothetical protein